MQIRYPGIDRLLRILQGADRVERAGRPEPAQRPGGVAAGDKVTISSEGRELQALWQRLMEGPDIREEKVTELRKAIQEGRYRVPAEEIAARMLEGWGDKP